MDIKDKLHQLRQETGMNRKEFADRFYIPYRTMQDWELGNRKMPEYLLRLMAYRIRAEKIFKERNIIAGQLDQIKKDGEDNEENT